MPNIFYKGTFSTVLMGLRSHFAVYDEKYNKLIPIPVVPVSFPFQQLACQSE